MQNWAGGCFLYKLLIPLNKRGICSSNLSRDKRCDMCPIASITESRTLKKKIKPCLWCHSEHFWASWKICLIPQRELNLLYDLWNASLMLCQLSYTRFGMQPLFQTNFCQKIRVWATMSTIINVCDVTLSVYLHQTRWKTSLAMEEF